MIDFAGNPIGWNIVLFCLAGCGVWWSGTRLSTYVDLIADRTGLGQAFAGALLLGGSTSLPEVATTLTASFSGAAELAATNLVGGIALQMVVLAVVDALVLRNRALTFFSPTPTLLMQGVMLIAISSLFIVAVVSGEFFSWWAVGVWPILLAVAYVGVLWIIYHYEGSSRWEPAGEVAEPPESSRDLKDVHQSHYADTSSAKIYGYFAVMALCVLIFGYFVSRLADTLASQTGLSQGIIGATVLALATSLPEVSTTWGAVRFGAYSMAAANILGTNSLSLALFLPAELAYRDGLILESLDVSIVFLTALGILITATYLWGLLERRDRTLWGMGWDSAAVLVIYAAGLTLYATRF